MKRVIILFILIAATALAAELTMEIPFDQNIILPEYSGSGTDHFESAWMTVTNTGTEAQEYKIEFQDNNVPEGWVLGVCNEQTCYMSNFSVPFPLEAGESKLIHITLSYNSNGNFTFPITFSEGDLTEPLVYEFTFTIGESAAGEDLIVNDIISNYPNPFNPTTTISFDLAKDSNVILDIFNIKGQKIYTLVNEHLNAGYHNITWNGLDNSGKKVSSGIFFYRFKTNEYSKTKKMMMLK